MKARSVRRVLAASLFASGLGQILGVGCAKYDIELDEPCRQAGFTIASRTFACTGDTKLSNDRYGRFASAYRCVVSEVTADTFYCSNALADRTCAQVLADGDDLEAWLGAAPGCGAILVRADGSALPNADLPGGTLDADPRCGRIVQAAALARTTCAPETATDFGATREHARARLDSEYLCMNPDYGKLPPDAPRDEEQLLLRCLDSIRAGGSNANPELCTKGTDAFYRELVLGCQGVFLRPRR